MRLNLIGLATVKAQLGITDGSLDPVYTALIPIVSASIREILNYQYDDYLTVQTTNGSDQVKFNLPVEMGQVLISDNLPEDAYIIAYNKTTGYYTISVNAIATGSVECYLGLNVRQWPTVAKMVAFRYADQNTKTSKDIISWSAGKYSETYSQNEVNNRYNYPAQYILDLGTSFIRVS